MAPLLCRPLFAFGEQHLSLDRRAAAEDLHFHRVPGLLAAEGVGEVVQVLNGLAVEFHQDVAGLETGLGGGRAFADIGELYTVDALGEIGDGAEVRAVSCIAADGANTAIAVA